jgi:hypothetical protein
MSSRGRAPAVPGIGTPSPENDWSEYEVGSSPGTSTGGGYPHRRVHRPSPGGGRAGQAVPGQVEDGLPDFKVRLRAVRRAPGAVDLRRAVGGDDRGPKVCAPDHGRLQPVRPRQRFVRQAGGLHVSEELAVEGHRSQGDGDDGEGRGLRRGLVAGDPPAGGRNRSGYLAGQRAVQRRGGVPRGAAGEEVRRAHRAGGGCGRGAGHGAPGKPESFERSKSVFR